LVKGGVMATYTDNYTMTKPTYAEQADISVINANMDIIDNVMHSSQISLAPAYDINETYNTGDIVMHELLMYKCLEDNVTGAWDSTKWTRTTAGEESGGGADLDIYGEASGIAEASFSDGAEASLVVCVIGIVPTQDLHGYSKPWAGGSGKNKLDASTATTNTLNGVTFTVVRNDANEVIRIDVTGTANAGTTFSIGTATIEAGAYIFSGYTDGSNVGTKYINYSGIVNAYGSDAIATITETKTTTVTLQIANGAETEFSIYPMIRESTAPSGFEPYSNICPITGYTDVTVTVASTSGGSGDDTTVSLGRTVYGGTLDVANGKLTVTWDNIASYAGETLKGEWLSSMDEYDALSTPTTGAQVAYELATPQTFNLTPTQVKTLLGQNYVSHDGGGTISLVYIKKDSTIIPNPSDAEVPLTGLEISGKGFKITDARIPTPPTNNGAYVLTVTVSGGTPTYSWENA
jgi:hypothetical protein